MPLTETQRAELQKLVRTNDVVLFMKGNRHFPQCGFSATVIGILNELGPKYDTVNILESPVVREGMKELSSWPTFPQLYVRGEFVGGCDIVKDLHASGELAKVLGVSQKPVEPPRVTITPAAAKAFQDALADAGTDVLRLDIDPQFACDLHLAAKEEGDLETKSNGAALYVGRASARRADGITIDFVEGPKGMAFKIENPNEPPHVRPIGPKALKTLIDEGKVTLFDVRPEDERARASIPQAKALDAKGQEYLFGLPKSSPIALHCHHGTRSRAAAEEILHAGFTHVYNLEGGIEAWSREIDPSVPRY
jgi:monothiol glutaredoxin